MDKGSALFCHIDGDAVEHARGLLCGQVGLGHADDLVEAVACLVHAEDHEQRNDHADKDQEDIQMVQVDAPALFPGG